MIRNRSPGRWTARLLDASVQAVSPYSTANNAVTGYNGNTEANKPTSYFIAENGTLKPGNYSAAVLDENYHVKSGYSVFDFTIDANGSVTAPSAVTYNLVNSYPGWAGRHHHSHGK